MQREKPGTLLHLVLYLALVLISDTRIVCGVCSPTHFVVSVLLKYSQTRISLTGKKMRREGIQYLKLTALNV